MRRRQDPRFVQPVRVIMIIIIILMIIIITEKTSREKKKLKPVTTGDKEETM